MKHFLQQLEIQRLDDHRYYHQSRVNQALHFLSALSFLVAYGLLFYEPAWAALVAWIVSMPSRQAGHFFFEPRTYDEVNRVTHDHKESIKVGYNLRRKVVLMGLWFLIPTVLYFDRGFFGIFEPSTTLAGYLHALGLLWLWLGIGALVFRVVQLAFLKDPTTGLVWMTKILTDPFHDIKLYHAAPGRLLRGEWMDPMHHLKGGDPTSSAA